MQNSKKKKTQSQKISKTIQTRNYIKFTFYQINDFSFVFEQNLLAKLSIKFEKNGKIQDLISLRERITQNNKDKVEFKYQSNRMQCKQYNDGQITTCYLILQVQVLKFRTDHKQVRNEVKQVTSEHKQIKKDMIKNVSNQISTKKIQIKSNMNPTFPILSNTIHIPLQKFLKQPFTNNQLKVDILQSTQRLCNINLNIISLSKLKYYLLIKQVSLKTQIFQEKYWLVVENQVRQVKVGQVRIVLRMNQWHSYQAHQEQILPMVLATNNDHLIFNIQRIEPSTNQQSANPNITSLNHISQSNNEDQFQFNISNTINQGIKHTNYQGIKNTKNQGIKYTKNEGLNKPKSIKSINKIIQKTMKQAKNQLKIKPITKTIQQLYQQGNITNGYVQFQFKFLINRKQSYLRFKLKLVLQSDSLNDQQQ